MNEREPEHKWQSPVNLLAIGLVAGTFLVIALARDHRWLGLWAALVFVGLALMPMPGRADGDERVMNLASAVLGRPVALRRDARERINPGEVPANARRWARIATLVVVALIALLLT